MHRIINKYGFIFFLVANTICYGQKVTVSREINVRNNYAYDILPNIEDHIIFYHDRGTEHNFEIYDQNLRYKNSIQPEFEKKNILPTGVIAMDSAFHFYYTYKEGSNIFFKAIAYDKNVSLIDSTTYNIKERKVVSSNPRFAYSQDKSKVLVFTPNEQFLNLQLIDNHTLKIIYDFNLIVQGVNLKSDFEKVLVSNDGEVFIITRKASMWKIREPLGFTMVRIINKDNILLHKFTPESDEISNLKMDYDEINKRIVLAGFTTSGDESKVNGYFGFSMPASSLPEEAEIIINRFTSEFASEVSGKKNKKIRELTGYTIQDIILRQDGGVIIVSESVREFTRRSQMAAPGQFGNNLPLRGFIDYYHEDLVILATFPDGKEHWKKILFKKQFSQDDNAIYSSYFLVKTPSRIRLIYNDEIKNSNTVSEYIMDPTGNFERKSVLSTEYQNLKLRFRDAIQIGSSSIIIPSEKQSKINMVRIDYEIQ
jgi:hypothetical protein